MDKAPPPSTWQTLDEFIDGRLQSIESSDSASPALYDIHDTLIWRYNANVLSNAMATKVLDVLSSLTITSPKSLRFVRRIRVFLKDESALSECPDSFSGHEGEEWAFLLGRLGTRSCSRRLCDWYSTADDPRLSIAFALVAVGDQRGLSRIRDTMPLRAFDEGDSLRATVALARFYQGDGIRFILKSLVDTQELGGRLRENLISCLSFNVNELHPEIITLGDHWIRNYVDQLLWGMKKPLKTAQ